MAMTSSSSRRRMESDDLAPVREAYAEEIRRTVSLRSTALVRAFATVPRERFLAPGPWVITRLGPGGLVRETTQDADPRHLYQDVLVVIDPQRLLNNGQPSSLAAWLDALDPRTGDHVLHVGCGPGYYTAILAEVVGPTGHVTALEIDPELASGARANLADFDQVEVIEGNGVQPLARRFDGIIVNAGACLAHPTWLEALRPGGRLILPLTVDDESWRRQFPAAPGIGWGYILQVKRAQAGYTASFISPVFIFHCLGARDAALDARLREGFEADTWRNVRSVRRDAHPPQESCWLHTEASCISMQEPGGSGDRE